MRVRRIVTGHDDCGASLIVEDAPISAIHRFGGEAGPIFHEVWRTEQAPNVLATAPTPPADAPLTLAPPKGGTLLRIVEIPPERPEDAAIVAAALPNAFTQAGVPDAHRANDAGAPHHTMHRTSTVDYGIVLDGEITLILDREETTVRAGDVIIQRGTSHGWSNRAATVCRIAFVLVDAGPEFASTALPSGE